jgi:hypothetical protein
MGTAADPARAGQLISGVKRMIIGKYGIFYFKVL